MLYSIIRLVHFFTILFIALTPFFNNYRTLFIHFLFIPLLVLHWKLNDDTCILTEIEKYIRKTKQNKQTFIGSIMGPIYEPKSETVQFICLILWCISLKKVYNVYEF